jgi:DNA-binding GntR family transcriptional regulator
MRYPIKLLGENKVIDSSCRKEFLMIDYINLLVRNTNLNQNKPIRQVVYESLRKTIISGIIPAGERLVEKTYAERLNISRTPVREALRMLEMEDLVENVPRVGVIIKRISVKDAVEIFEIRHSLEVLTLTEAMTTISEEEVKKISELIDLSEKENEEGNVEEVMKLFGEFNLRIYEASRMKRLNGMISKLDEYIQRFRAISMSSYDRRVQAIKEHREILQRVVEKDKGKIDCVIRRHLRHSLDVVINGIK